MHYFINWNIKLRFYLISWSVSYQYYIIPLISVYFHLTSLYFYLTNVFFPHRYNIPSSLVFSYSIVPSFLTKIPSLSKYSRYIPYKYLYLYKYENVCGCVWVSVCLFAFFSAIWNPIGISFGTKLPYASEMVLKQ